MAINLYKDISSFADEEKGIFHVVVDVPKGGSNKYEYDEVAGYFALDRVLHHQMFYPFDYGFIPQTHAGDGDAVDVCLLVTYPTFPGCVIKARAIGYIKTADEKGEDMKIIAVPADKVDPRFKEIQSIGDLPSHFQEELLIHFKEIKKLEKEKYAKVEIGGFGTKEEAYEIIREAQKVFSEKH